MICDCRTCKIFERVRIPYCRFWLIFALLNSCVTTQMGRDKKTVSQKIRKYTNKYEDEFTTDGKVLFCQLCETDVSFERSAPITSINIAKRRHT